MISYNLICEEAHSFEAWFRNSSDFDRQKERQLIACPQCGSQHVDKALMAPAVSTSRRKAQVALALGEEQKKVLAQLKEMSKAVRENADYVGDRFAEEARKIHFGETEARGIYGEASADDAKALIEEGVEFMPLPMLPEDQN
ncbi:DUF1178 family protein [Nitratireductor pacificus]|uniref:Uncharacterized protein n=1 Tax=Nitratireductor pacificus pht-3B TaxID=391937 RepID=K2M9S4_9HYPH|nr:DUF1178 family protein [Nitratireductor pacificus]EKF17755.1 hypothetical protein NA2_15933 [Nitratireductor pacificus pht-3B]